MIRCPKCDFECICMVEEGKRYTTVDSINEGGNIELMDDEVFYNNTTAETVYQCDGCDATFTLDELKGM